MASYCAPLIEPAGPIVVLMLGVDVQIWPPDTAATSFVPSEDEATEVQNWLVARVIQVTPQSVDV